MTEAASNIVEIRPSADIARELAAIINSREPDAIERAKAFKEANPMTQGFGEHDKFRKAFLEGLDKGILESPPEGIDQFAPLPAIKLAYFESKRAYKSNGLQTDEELVKDYFDSAPALMEYMKKDTDGKSRFSYFLTSLSPAVTKGRYDEIKAIANFCYSYSPLYGLKEALPILASNEDRLKLLKEYADAYETHDKEAPQKFYELISLCKDNLAVDRTNLPDDPARTSVLYDAFCILGKLAIDYSDTDRMKTPTALGHLTTMTRLLSGSQRITFISQVMSPFLGSIPEPKEYIGYYLASSFRGLSSNKPIKSEYGEISQPFGRRRISVAFVRAAAKDDETGQTDLATVISVSQTAQVFATPRAAYAMVAGKIAGDRDLAIKDGYKDAETYILARYPDLAL